MGRSLYLTKVIIRNFRSIQEVHLNNISDVTVLVGPNESGKSSILKALSWFGIDSQIESEDIPIELQVNGKRIEQPIVEAYFEVIDREKFEKMLNSIINTEMQGIIKDYPLKIDIIKLMSVRRTLTELELTPVTLKKINENESRVICKNREGNVVVARVVYKKADLTSVSELRNYIDALSKEHKNARGILIAPSLTNRARNLLKKEDGLEFKELVLSSAGFKDIRFLKLEKYEDGHFNVDLYDSELNSVLEEITEELVEILKGSILHINLSDLFGSIFEAEIRGVLKSNNVPPDAIPNGIETIKNNTNFLNTITSIVNELESIDSKYESQNVIEKFKVVKQNLHQIIQRSPTTNTSFSIGGRNFSLNPRNIFNNTYNKLSSKVGDIRKILETDKLENIVFASFSKLRPEFVFLSEEMELKRSVPKKGKLSQILNEEKGEYIINARLFRILGIGLKKFEKKDVDTQDLILNNKLDEFSRTLERLWKQQKIHIKCNVRENAISFRIVEVDENNRPIPGKETFPEMRSRGFKWYLAYFITLEYLKLKGEIKDIILLLDDPAVFLHEQGQKDFLDTINTVSKNVQIIYNTHLISLFDERELDRVLLVQLDKENRTSIRKPWTNKKRDIIAPIRYALGFDKLIFEDFENFDGILFVEGISDKFIFEGLQKAGAFSKKWYIYPLSGGDDVENNEIVKRIEQLECIYQGHNNDLRHYFILDGDKRPEFEEKKGDEEENEKDLKIVFLGNEDQEMEDLIDKEFYLECVFDCYCRIFIHNPPKVRKLKEAIDSVKNETGSKKITKLLEKEFKTSGLGGFSKGDISKTIKRKISKDPSLVKYLQPIVKQLKDVENIMAQNKRSSRKD